jgi:exonuclease SbcC
MAMRQLVRLTLINWTSFVKEVIELAGAGEMTVLTGQSRNGKSNVIRALRKLFYNIPSGDGFIRTGAKECIIAAEYDDGHKVSYRRTRGGISRYTITYPDGKTADYDDGMSVPMEVQEITGVKPLLIGGLEPININIAEQLDGPFLGTKVVSAPARAKILGKLAGTEELDYTAKVLGIDINRRKQRKKELEDDIKDFEAKVKQYDYLEDLDSQIKALGLIMIKIKKFTEERNRLKELATKRDCLLVQIRAAQEQVAGTKFVEDAAVALAGVETRSHTHTVLINLENKLIETQDKIGIAKNLLDQTVSVQRAGMMLEQTEKMSQKRCQLQKLGQTYSNLLNLKADNEAIITQTAKVPEAERLMVKIEASKAKVVKLLSRNTALVANKNAISLCEEALILTAGTEIAREKLSRVVQLETKKKTLWNTKTILTGFQNNIELEKNIITNKSIVIKGLEEEYLNTFTELGRCPWCGGEVKPECLKEVI